MEHMLSEFLDRGLPLCGLNPDVREKDLSDDDLRMILRVAYAPSVENEHRADQSATLAQRKLYRLRHRGAAKWAVKFEDGEICRYTLKQMQDKFGVETVQAGMDVRHEARGPGKVLMTVYVVEKHCETAVVRFEHGELRTHACARPRGCVRLRDLMCMYADHYTRKQMQSKFGVGEEVEAGMKVSHPIQGNATVLTGFDHVVKKWAIQFENGEVHKYTAKQMKKKFGIGEPETGMKIKHRKRGRGTVLLAIEVVEGDNEFEEDEFDSMSRKGLLARIRRNVEELEASELLVMPTLTWGGHLGHHEIPRDEQIAHRNMGFLCTFVIHYIFVFTSLFL